MEKKANGFEEERGASRAVWGAETAVRRELMGVAFRIPRTEEADKELLGELTSLNKRRKCDGNRDDPRWLIREGAGEEKGRLYVKLVWSQKQTLHRHRMSQSAGLL